MGWKLEVGRMLLYMAFPVGLFHLFNQPEFFESYVVKTKEEWYPPKLNENTLRLRQELDKINQAREAEQLKLLKEQQGHLKADKS